MDVGNRDGSLLRKKKEKWSREREDDTLNHDWFPFGSAGSPGGGNPNKKHEARDYHTEKILDKKMKTSMVVETKEEPSPIRCPAEDVLEAMRVESTHTAKTSDDPPVSQTTVPNKFMYSPYVHTIPIEYIQAFQSGSGHSVHLAYPPIPVPFHMIPPGAIPIPPPTVSDNQFASYTEQWTQQLPQHWTSEIMSRDQTLFSHNLASSINQPTNAGGLENESNSSESRPLNMYTMCAVKDGHSNADIRTFPTSNRTRTASVYSSVSAKPHVEQRERTISDVSEILLEEQAIEKVKREEMQAEMERELERKASRERAEKEERRQKEIERQEKEEQQLREERDRTQEKLIEALEKAKREAALMKKAKLYKHVLENASPDVEKKLLGVENSDDGLRILKEVNAFERQRQIEFEEIKSKGSPKENPSRGRSTCTKTRWIVATSAEDRTIKPGRHLTSSTPFHRNSRGRMSLNADTRPCPSSVTRRSASAERKNTTSRIPSLQKQRETDKKNCVEGERKEDQTVEKTQKNCNETVNRSFLRPSPGSWTACCAGNPSEILCHSVNIRNLPDREPFSLPSRSRQNSMDAKSLLFEFTPVRRGKMRVGTECIDESQKRDALRGSVESNDDSSSGSISPTTRDNSQKSPSIPSINVYHDSDVENRCCNNNNEKTPSVVHSPIAHLSRPRSSSNTPTLFHKRLGELGALRSVDSNDVLSPEQRHHAESHFTSMEKLRMSMNNLSTIDRSPERERPASPQLQKFRSRAPQYRSFNLKRTSEKQTTVLDRLNILREQLRQKDNFQENRTALSRVGSMAFVKNDFS